MLNDIDALVRASMAEWKVPGLALAIIQGDETLLLQGWGVRDVDTPAPVDADTQFLLCSITKSFTAAGLGLLVDARKLDWSRPVREVLPEFRLHDTVATERATVRDLLSHTIGLPRHDWLHMPGDLSRAQMLAALRHLEPNQDLREGHQYQNLGYLVAGAITERLTGQRWEDFITERLLQPLGFTDFSFSIEALAAAPNHAHPHAMHRDEPLRAQLWPISVPPAGGLNASVTDLAKWMRLSIRRGKTDQGVQLLSAQVLAQMTTPRVHAGNAGVEEVGDLHYGLGLMVQHYRGERTVSHSGSWLGWGTSMTLLPARGIGIAVLTNRAPSAVPFVLTSSVLDRLCSHAPIDWFGRFQTLRQQLLSQQATDAQAKRELRRPDTQPSHALAEYTGDYEHPAYGRMQIAHRDGKLDWRWRGLPAELAHRHYDIFTLPDKPAEFFSDGLNLTFGYDRDGTIDRVEAPLEPTVAEVVFRRVASGDVLDLAFRERCTGTFMHGVQQIDIALDAAGQLTMAVTGQPTYRLLPFHDRTFELEGAPGYRAEFRCAQPPVVDAIVLRQPNGVFIAARQSES